MWDVFVDANLMRRLAGSDKRTLNGINYMGLLDGWTWKIRIPDVITIHTIYNSAQYQRVIPCWSFLYASTHPKLFCPCGILQNCLYSGGKWCSKVIRYFLDIALSGSQVTNRAYLTHQELDLSHNRLIQAGRAPCDRSPWWRELIPKWWP